MKIFLKIQEILASVGFIPGEYQTNYCKLSFGQITGAVTCSMSAVALGVYIVEEFDRIEECMETIFSFTVLAGTTISFTSIMFKSDKLFNMIELAGEEASIRSENNPASRAIHEGTDRLVEKLSKIIYFAAMKLGVPGFILLKAIPSYFKYFTTDAGRDAFELLLPAYLPFDWQNPIGYFIAVIMAYAGAFVAVRILVCFAILAFACFLTAYSVTKDWKTVDIPTLDEMTQTKQHSELDILKQCTEFVRSHSNAKHLINEFMDVFEACTFIVVVGCIIGLCAVLIMVHVEILSKDTIEPVWLLKSIFYGFCTFSLIFISCEIGQQLTNLFEEIADRFGQLNWYLLPMKVQRLLPTIMINAQEPVVVGCFGIINGSRVQFQKAFNIVYKIVNLLRKTYN